MNIQGTLDSAAPLQADQGEPEKCLGNPRTEPLRGYLRSNVAHDRVQFGLLRRLKREQSQRQGVLAVAVDRTGHTLGREGRRAKALL